MFGIKPLEKPKEQPQTRSPYKEEHFDLIRRVGELFFTSKYLHARRFQEILDNPLSNSEIRTLEENPEHYVAVLFATRMRPEERTNLRDNYPPNITEENYCVSLAEWTGKAIHYLAEANLDFARRATAEIKEVHDTFYFLATRILGQKVDYSSRRKENPQIRDRLEQSVAAQ